MRELVLFRIVPAWCAVWSIIAYCAMGFDKHRAKKGGWRVRERTLLLMSLLGGSVGGLAGMKMFRHKTRHWYFRWGIPAMLILHLGLYIWALIAWK